MSKFDIERRGVEAVRAQFQGAIDLLPSLIAERKTNPLNSANVRHLMQELRNAKAELANLNEFEATLSA